ncbi:Cytochrome d ubiquinol oxidase subunit II [Vibrio cholerae]|nr:Cytochrome d ubiquinol oxidase subunit II [Vibrio cholerae]
MNSAVAERWFSFPEVILLAPVPIIVFATILVVDRYLKRVPTVNDAGVQWPFFGVVIVMPTILLYTFFVYRIFKGKATDLSYL